MEKNPKITNPLVEKKFGVRILKMNLSGIKSSAILVCLFVFSSLNEHEEPEVFFFRGENVSFFRNFHANDAHKNAEKRTEPILNICTNYMKEKKSAYCKILSN